MWRLLGSFGNALAKREEKDSRILEDADSDKPNLRGELPGYMKLLSSD